MKIRLPHKAGAGGDARKGSRLAYFPENGGYFETPIYDRYALEPGTAFAGPAIVEERESTLIVGPSSRACVDEGLNIVVELTDER
jgi:N-methylhydantoinase A